MTGEDSPQTRARSRDYMARKQKTPTIVWVLRAVLLIGVLGGLAMALLKNG